MDKPSEFIRKYMVTLTAMQDAIHKMSPFPVAVSIVVKPLNSGDVMKSPIILSDVEIPKLQEWLAYADKDPNVTRYDGPNIDMAVTIAKDAEAKYQELKKTKYQITTNVNKGDLCNHFYQSP